MARGPARPGADRTPRRTRRPAASKHAQLLKPGDVRALLLDLASQLAPADVTTLLGHEQKLRARAAQLTTKNLSLLQQQLNLGFDLLRDHVDGACPQIPYYTIMMIAAGIYYFATELDLIPDSLPRVGRLDDAAVMAVACRLADAGLRRYATWRGLQPVSGSDTRRPAHPPQRPMPPLSSKV